MFGNAKPHSLDATAVAHALNVNPPQGLNSGTVEERRKNYGSNILQSIRPRPAWRILADQFASLIVALLSVAAAVAWLTGDVVEAVAILIVLVLNALVGFSTEWQAGRALDALRRQAHTTARVRRDGVELSVDAEDLVPSDIVILNSGDRVPADARIIEAAALRAEESALTGESAPVNKSAEVVSAEAPIAERHSMLYLGTTIAAGRAVAIVTATGASTELGHIGRLVAEAPDESTPLEIRLNELGHRLVYIVLAIAVTVLITGWLRGDDFWIMVEVSISLAVAAVPEGLPAVTTLILALGVLRMARERAIVRRLPTVETLGSTTVVCTDKTGTLTENRMSVREFHLSDGRRIELEGRPLSLNGDGLLAHAVQISVLCNEAVLHRSSANRAEGVGDPTETALLSAAHALGMDIDQERDFFPKIHEVPFDAATKRMITVHRAGDGRHFVAMKGAPGVVLDASTGYSTGISNQPLDADSRARFLSMNEAMARRALRVLGLAGKWLDRSHFEVSASTCLEAGFTFVGLVGMIDPPRPGVAAAIEGAHAAGIRVVMLTGDQIQTARAIAQELRLNGEAPLQALHARDLANASPEELARMVRTTDVFARVSPEDKLRIVEALQQAGEIVAVTGDGVNDAPALKQADIGVAMGERGTEVAKEASDLVLADDNFSTILKAVEGGRTIYANITKFVHMMFSNNLAEVLAIFVAIATGLPLPLLPLQILWMNLVTDVFPALALAVEPAERNIMRHPPRSPQTALLSRRFLILIVWQGILLATIVLAAYVWALSYYGEGAHARTVAFLALIGTQIGHFFNCRSRTRSAFEGLARSPFIWLAAATMVGLQLLAFSLTPLTRVLDLSRPTMADGGIAGLTILLPIAVVELTKWISRRE
jgi:P-type Ca2+ transporter type 2C